MQINKIATINPEQTFQPWNGEPIGEKVKVTSDFVDGKVNGVGDMSLTGSKGGDKRAIRDLLQGKGAAEHLSAEERKALYNRLLQGGLDASHTMKNIDKLAKKHKDDPEAFKAALSNYMDRIGAIPNLERRAQIQAENLVDPSRMTHGIPGLDTNGQMGSTLEQYSGGYTITGKINGEKVKIKVSEQEAISSAYEPGRLPGLTEKLKEMGIKDLSNLEDFKIDGKAMGPTANINVKKIGAKELNAIAQGEKTFEDFKKLSFWQKIGNAFSSIGNAIKKGFEGAVNVVKGIGKAVAGVVAAPFKGIEALVNGKNPFTASISSMRKGFEGLSNDWKNAATNFTDAYSNMVKAGTSFLSAGADALFAGSGIGNAISKIGNGAANLVSKAAHWIYDNTIGWATNSVTNFTKGAEKVSQGKMDGLLDMGMVAVDVATTVGTGGAASIAKAGAKTVIKETGKNLLQSGAEDLVIQAGKDVVTGKKPFQNPHPSGPSY
ncbi:MAG: hypothetical protein AAGB12_11605 [Pseudomonadota bacterium]